MSTLRDSVGVLNLGFKASSVTPLRNSPENALDSGSSSSYDNNERFVNVMGIALPEEITYALGDCLQFKQVEVVCWARDLTASSAYGDPEWSVSKIAGPPSHYPTYGDDARCWAPAVAGSVFEWVEYHTEQEMQIKQLRIYETNFPGALTTVKLFDKARGDWREVLSIPTTCGTLPHVSRINNVDIPKEFQYIKTNRVRLEFNQNNCGSWYEIDAIETMGTVMQSAGGVFQEGEAPELPAPGSIQRAFFDMFNKQFLSDVTFVLQKIISPGQYEEVPLHAHLSILAGRSPVFKKMVEKKALVPNSVPKVVDDVDAELFTLFIEFLYKDNQVTIPPKFLVPLYMLADYYQVDSLARLCEKEFPHVLTPANATVLYYHCNQLGFAKLEELCLTKIKQELKEVMQTADFQLLSKDLVMQILKTFTA